MKAPQCGDRGWTGCPRNRAAFNLRVTLCLPRPYTHISRRGIHCLTPRGWFAPKMFTVWRNKVPIQRDDPTSTIAIWPPAPEWVVLRTEHPNVLIVGTFDTTEAVVATLVPYLRPPVYCWVPDASLPAPHDVTTMLIRDVASLSLDQQHTLLWWLDQAGPGHAQIVSTALFALFPLVEHGLFLEGLYYRLNTVLLDAPAPVVLRTTGTD
jgi:hypothetical protein